MKTSLNPQTFLVLFFVLMAGTMKNVNAQSDIDGPIKSASNIGDKEIVFLSWLKDNSWENNTLKSDLLNVKSLNTKLIKDQMFEEKNIVGTENRFLVADKADLNGDGKVEYAAIVSSSTNNTNEYHLLYPEIEQGTSKITAMNRHKILYKKNIREPRIKTGDFDGDNRDEVALAFLTQLNKVRIELYDFNTEGELVIKGWVEEKSSVTFNAENSQYISLLSADFDGNGDKELALIIQTKSVNDYQIRVYDVMHGSDTLKISKVNQLDYNNKIKLGIKGVTTDFNNDNKEEISFSVLDFRGGLVRFSYGDDSDTTTNNPFDKSLVEKISFVNNHYSGNILAGDFNGDNQQDVLIYNNGSIEVYTPTKKGSLKFKRIINNRLPFNTIEVDEYEIKIADFNSDGKDDLSLLTSNLTEIKGDIFNPFPTTYKIDVDLSVYSLTAYTYLNLLYSKRLVENHDLGIRQSNETMYLTQLLVGDFSGDNFTIGKGQRYIKEEVMQPIVILNAPPIHFDQIGDDTIDINACFSEDCNSSAFYRRAEGTSRTVGIEVSNNYNFSASVKAGGSFLGIGAEAYINSNYGKSLRNSSESTRSFETEINITAVKDDEIYATVTDYEIWTYPVYSTFNNTYLRSIVTIAPMKGSDGKPLVETGWYPSKGNRMESYIHPHEPGNVLSYPDKINIDGPRVSENINEIKDVYELTIGTSKSFGVNWEETFSKGSSTERSVSMEIGGSISGWGIELSGSAAFESVSTSTHNVTVNKGIQIEVELGTVNDSKKGYTIKPYIFWDNQGAMVLDYATIVSESSVWWNNIYGQLPDPAFILPWRHEMEKGLTDEDLALNDLQNETRSILIRPSVFSKGDTVTVYAILNNYSLIDLAKPLEVGFYLGNPKKGGAAISDIARQERFQLNNLSSKTQDTISFKWEATDDKINLPRFYGHIDPDNTLDEIHEGNNIGWIPLGKEEKLPSRIQQIFSDEATPTKNDSYIYPNPLANRGTIQINVVESSDVLIQLYDITGRMMKTVVDEYKLKGSYSVELNMDDIKGGVYFYSFQTTHGSEAVRFIKK